MTPREGSETTRAIAPRLAACLTAQPAHTVLPRRDHIDLRIHIRIGLGANVLSGHYRRRARPGGLDGGAFGGRSFGRFRKSQGDALAFLFFNIPPSLEKRHEESFGVS